jgi:hypothetical protein
VSTPLAGGYFTEQQYAGIAVACDRLLRAPGTSLARVAISALHVMNEHPGCLATYAPLLHVQPGPGRPLIELADGPRAVLRAARALGRSIGKPAQASPAPAPVDVVLVSHLANPAQLDEENDFYFGALQSLLRERGVTSLLVLIDHLPNEQARDAQMTRTFPSARFLLPRTISAASEIGIWQRCITAHRLLHQEALTAGKPLDMAVAKLASRHALLSSTAANLRLHGSLSSLFKLLNPRIVVATCEGDASERMIWRAARTANHRPLCVGYQHTRLLRLAHAIKRPVSAPGVDCDPDVILTLGPIPHAALASSPGLSAVRLITYGSHRRSEPAEILPPEMRSRTCLVLPDADDRECRILFEFALACARQIPTMTFVLRPHPIVNTTTLRLRHRGLRDLPANASWSVGTTLEQECKKARYCLYRGSSAAMHAVLAGIKPFYVTRAGELPFDPLFALSDWRETVTSPEDFSSRAHATDISPDRSAAQYASSFYDRYVSRVRPAAIDELLRMVNR